MNAPPRTRTHVWWVVIAALIVPVIGPAWIGEHGTAWTYAAVALWVAILAFAIVTMRRQRRRYDTEVAAWAAEQTRRTERLRIAADLHDLVSHGLGTITVRAAAARRVPGPAGEAERIAALADIEKLGRDTSVELRRMLSLLREDGHAPLRPADTLADLPGIVEAARRAGLTVSFTPDDDVAVSAGAAQVACAVVREGLNNVLRHAGPVAAHVTLRREHDGVLVEVSDDGPAASWVPNPGAGHGLDALQARVEAVGGTFEAGPRGRGFRIAARLGGEQAQ